MLHAFAAPCLLVIVADCGRLAETVELYVTSSPQSIDARHGA
jgi:hypothetical protein